MTDLDPYDYDLPKDAIAQTPLARRSDARLMIVNREHQTLTHAHIRDLPQYVEPRDLLALNDTRVVPARLVGYRTRTRGRWQGLFLAAQEDGLWKVLSKTRGKLTGGETITLRDEHGVDQFRLEAVAPLGQGAWAMRVRETGGTWELLQRVGRIPLPPYIRGGEMLPEDRERYQTVFARQPGAVAAPTAGLHFTPELLGQLTASGVGTCQVTLHVGVGTFRPIQGERLEDHQMHAEWGSVSAEAAAQLNQRRASGGRVIAVGTTVTRLLETAVADDGTFQPWEGETDLFIRPGFRFRAIDALLTNFHLPKSTLLVLVHTFGGSRLLQRAYREAVEEHYRFFSYGDAMLII